MLIKTLRKTHRLIAALAVAVALTGAAVASATAAPADQLRYAGSGLNGLQIPVGTVDMEAWSSTPAREVQFFLGDQPVGVDTTLDQRDGYWVASVPVQLTTPGSAQLKAKIVVDKKAFRTIWKYFTVVTPPPAVSPVAVNTTGKPGPDNTGVPAGVALSPSGSLVVTKPGTVIDGLDIQGCLTVQANNVTVKNTRITCTNPSRARAVRMTSGAKGLLITDSEVNGTGTTDIGIEASSAVIRRVEVSNVNDGIRIGNDILIEDSWVHDLTRLGSGHPDAVQGISAQNVVIRDNTLNPRNYTTGDLGNAAIMLGSEAGTKLSRNVTITGNFLDGGNYSLNVSGSITASALEVRDNIFGTDSRYGPVISPVRVPIGRGNVVNTTGLPVTVDVPKTKSSSAR
ncbi:hypothetical protein [Nocardioides flavescens]|uniref:Right handed beta helix region n=1 Tax=Nocardioides flavescens TaxID=2691959 RepID=A0A6L7F2R9_9ACTN|nr:hypothetical protein [Nocardioides flavescens]MXG89964.1 hypothetical protein [Nocardioides flavescens]